MFQGRAVEATGDLQLCPSVNGTQCVKPAFDAAHVRSSQGSQIENGAGAVRNHIGAGTAFHYIGIDAYSATYIIPLFDACELSGQFVHRVDPFFRGQACVRSATLDD